MSRDYSGILCRLERLKQLQPKRDGQPQWIARCPAHDDRRPSLAMWVSGLGNLCCRCYAGCTFAAVAQALGVPMPEWFADFDQKQSRARPAVNIVATYDYRDEMGVMKYQQVRLNPKDFRRRRQDGSGGWLWNLDGVEPLLYRLPELIASPPGELVNVVEGEKAADYLASLGFVATTSGSSSSWIRDFGRHLRGREVVILPDHDAAGFGYAEAVASSCLFWGARSIRLVHLNGLADGEGADDWLQHGIPTQDDAMRVRALKSAVSQAEVWRRSRAA